MDITIPPCAPLTGERKVPGDKSISHRALMFAALANGDSRIKGISRAGDPTSTRLCLESLGIRIEDDGDACIVHGKGLHGLNAASSPLDARNSGTTMRLLSGILCGQRFGSTLIGDASLMKRPMKRVIAPLSEMGARIKGTVEGKAPLVIEPTDDLQGITYLLQTPSAQVKSAILLAGLYAKGKTVVEEIVPTRDHTERLLGIKAERVGNVHRISLPEGKVIEARDYVIPGDPSSAAFLLAAALLIPGSELLLRDVCLNPTRIGFIGHLLELGAQIEIHSLHISSNEPFGNIVVRTSDLSGTLRIEGNAAADVVDEIPILSAVALASGCGCVVRNAKELRAKESDRIRMLVENMRRLGADVEEYDDGFAFESSRGLHGGRISTELDHRIAMSFGIIGCIVPGIVIEGAEHAAVSFPQFWSALGIQTPASGGTK